MPHTKKKTLLRIAHLSDLHFAKPSWNPEQLLSKRWLGNLNVWLSRKHSFDPAQLTTLIPLFHQKKITTILISGDLSSTSHPDEFALAQDFIRSLSEEGFSVFTVPGNHDQYTKSAYKKGLFYDFFPACYEEKSEWSLKEHRISCKHLEQDWWLIGMDTAHATSLLSSTGNFSEEIERELQKVLLTLPSSCKVILMNHFSLFSEPSFRKNLIRKEALRSLLQRNPCVKIFLHGHTHRHSTSDLRASHLPLILDSGSTAKVQGGSWNFIEITDQDCIIESFKRNDSPFDVLWEPFAKNTFSWESHEALV